MSPKATSLVLWSAHTGQSDRWQILKSIQIWYRQKWGKLQVKTKTNQLLCAKLERLTMIRKKSNKILQMWSQQFLQRRIFKKEALSHAWSATIMTLPTSLIRDFHNWEKKITTFSPMRGSRKDGKKTFRSKFLNQKIKKTSWVQLRIRNVISLIRLKPPSAPSLNRKLTLVRITAHFTMVWEKIMSITLGQFTHCSSYFDASSTHSWLSSWLMASSR